MHFLHQTLFKCKMQSAKCKIIFRTIVPPRHCEEPLGDVAISYVTRCKSNPGDRHSRFAASR